MEKLQGFSDQTRIWIYQSNRLLHPSEIVEINALLEEFNKEWATHGSKMKTNCFVIAPCFLIFAVDQSEIEASGCSIDSSVRVLKKIENKFDIQ
ncbi:MAG: ABC transporter ATPase, partial [Crocinitomicaceae bacterium]